MKYRTRQIARLVPLLALLAAVMSWVPAGAAAAGQVTAGPAHQAAWHTRAPLPVAQGGLATATVGGRILAIGGFSSNFKAALHTVQAYNPRINRWQTLAPMPTARGDLAAAAADGQVYAIGGLDSAGNPMATVEIYLAASNTWGQPPAPCRVTGSCIQPADAGAVSGHQTRPSLAQLDEGTTAMPGKAVISLSTGMEDPEKVTVAFLVAVGAAESGRPTLMFQAKEAVRLAPNGVAAGVACDGCPPLQDLLARYARAEERFMVCPVCFNAKQLDQGDLLPNAELAGSVQLWKWIGDDGATTFSY